MRSRARALVAFLVVLVLAPALPALGDTRGWVLYTHPDKLMSVRFPGRPIESKQDGQTADGKMQVKVATFIDGDRALVATAGIYPDGTKLEVKAALDHALDNMLAGFKGRVVAQKPITRDGFEGRDIRFEAPGPYKVPLRGTARIFVSVNPPSSYIAMAMQMDGSSNPNAQRFLDSVHLGKKVETRQ